MRRTNTDTTWMLRRFFTEIAAEVSGICSNYWMLVEMSQSGARQAHSGSSDGAIARAHRRVDAASFEADIAARLETLTADQRVILSLAFGSSPWPVVGSFEQREDRKRLGEHPGVALVSERARRAWLGAVRKRDRRAGEDERPVVKVVVEGKTIGGDSFEAVIGGKVDAYRRGPDPRAGVKAMLDRGFIAWLRGPSVSEQVLGEIRDDIAGLVRAAVAAWNVVAPQPDREGRVRHTGHRKAALGPATAYDGADEGDRPSGEYPRFAVPGVPFRRVAS